MEKYFDVRFLFDKQRIYKTIEDCSCKGKKGYVCVIDGNVLAESFKNKGYREILNKSTFNLCDGSSIAILASRIHNKELKPYTGPDLFMKYVSTKYKQCFVGNTEENLIKMEKEMRKTGLDTSRFKYIPLPFRKVEDFDYPSIANEINEFDPDLIWVSLGAPKQEIFISEIYPYLRRGLLFGIGAAFNFFLDGKQSKHDFLKKYNLIWLDRVIKEPKRVGRRALRYLVLIPKLIIHEIKTKRNRNETVS